MLAAWPGPADTRCHCSPTTWAYKFALLEAGVKARRRAWHGREIVIDDQAWPEFADAGRSAHEQLEAGELLSALRDAIRTSLTPHQRDVVEIAAGLVVAISPRIGGLLVAAWLGGIIVNLLILGGYGDIALRDFGLLLGALTLARLASATPGQRSFGR